MRAALALLALLIAGTAWAQPKSPPPQYPCGLSTTACAQLAPRTNVLTWMPTNDGTTLGTSGQFLNGAGGATFEFTYEAPDDFDAVQVVYADGGSAPWTLNESVVSSSSQYGGSGGLTPYDVNGYADNLFAPFTFNNGGNVTLPWPGAVAKFTGGSTGGAQVIPLLTSAGTVSGNTLTFTSTTTAAGSIIGRETPFAGEYANTSIDSAGLRCVTNDPVSSVTGTTVVLTNNINASCNGSAGVGSGQLVWISNAPIGSLSITLPTAPNTPQPTLVWSDWAWISSRPRIDGTIQVNDAVTGSASIPNGTTATAASTEFQIALSQALTGTVAATTTIGVSATTTAASAIGTTQVIWPVSSIAGIQRGQQVTGTNVASNTFVIYVDPVAQTVTVNLEPTAQIAQGTSLTFTNYYRTGTTENSGATVLPLSFPADDRPLILVRGFVSSGQPWEHSWPDNISGYEATTYGGNTPFIVSKLGPQSGGSAVDNISFPASGTLNGTSTVDTPVYMIRVLTRHNGIEIVDTGDSHIQGESTGSGYMGYVRYSAYHLNLLGIPIEVAHIAHGGQAWNMYMPAAMDVLQAIHPSIFVTQAATTNGSDWAQYGAAMFEGARNFVQSYGGRTIVTSDYCKQSNNPLEVPLAQAVNGTSGVLGAFLTTGSGTGAGYAVSWPGGPSGVTATLGSLSNQITLSSSETIPSGTLLNFNDLAATTTATSRTVTFATPAPYGSSAMDVTDSAGNIPADDTITTTGGSTTATLGTAATASGATIVHFLTIEPVTSTESRTQGNAFAHMASGPGSTETFFDTAKMVCSLSNVLQPGYTWDGVHIDDYGHDVIVAPAFELLLQQIIGN